jgi:hypothetical protein
MGFSLKERFDPFLMNVRRSASLEEVGDGELQKKISKGSRIKDVRIQERRVRHAWR